MNKKPTKSSKYDKSKSMFAVSPPLHPHPATDYRTVVRGGLCFWLICVIASVIARLW